MHALKQKIGQEPQRKAAPKKDVVAVQQLSYAAGNSGNAPSQPGMSLPITTFEEADKIEKIEFSKCARIEIVVERAVDLPMSTLASRVVVKLMSTDRKQIGNH